MTNEFKAQTLCFNGENEELRIRNSVEKLLLTLLFKNNLVGTKYLLEAITECCLSSSGYRTLSTEVYPKIAEKYKTSCVNIDRTIRTSIRDCYEYGDLIRLNEIFHCGMIGKKYPPTNGEFIFNVASHLRFILKNGANDGFFTDCGR